MALDSTIQNSALKNLFAGNPTEGTVFGSYGLKYPVDDIERERDDGTTIIDLKPEVRVFICGGEVTKDVVNVQVDRRVSSESSCSITLANPRGKYNVSLQDLMGNWREDKDILSTYDYDWIKSNYRDNYDAVDNAIKYAAGGDIANQIKDLVKNAAPKNTVVPITKMIFDVKHASAITKKEGDVIFDYRDPVYVFMKGRFSPYWYFAFSGVVAKYNESYRYGAEQTLNLECYDLLYLLKRKRYYQRGALLAAANIEASVRNVENVNATKPITSPAESTPTNLLKYALFHQKPEKEDLDKIKNLSFFESDLTSDINKTGYGTEKSYDQQMKLFKDSHKVEDSDAFIPAMYRSWSLKNKYNYTIKAKETTEFQIEFKFGSSNDFKKGSENTITQLLLKVKELKSRNLKFNIEGYTDGFGAYQYALDLSNARAKHIASILGVDWDRKSKVDNATIYIDSIPYTPIGITKEDYTVEVDMLQEVKGYGMGDESHKASKPGDQGIYATVRYYNIQTGDLVSNGSFEKYKSGELTAGGHNSNVLNITNIKKQDNGNLAGANIDDQMNRRIVLSVIIAEPIVKDKNTFDDWSSFVKERKPQIADPDMFTLSEINDIYFQWNGVNIDDFKEPVIKYHYDTLVRYWVRDFSLNKNDFEKYNKTGWKQDSGFGISGIHPALSYEFINNFNILPGVWKAITDKGNIKSDVDRIVVRPYDKIKECIFGSPTEIAPSNSDKQFPYGNEFNYFRPRVITLLPNKFLSNKLPVNLASFKLFGIESTTTYEYIEKLCTEMDYAFYTSPMGDIIFEPKMYDMHPLYFQKHPKYPVNDFSLKTFEKIEKRNIIRRAFNTELVGKPISFRATQYTNTKGDELIGYRKDFAYNFNPKANHPFFVMEKDISDFNDVFNSDMLKTSLTIMGMPLNTDTSQFSKFVQDLQNTTESFKNITLKEDPVSSTNSMNFPGIYIADGFTNAMRTSDINAVKVAKSEKEKELKSKSASYESSKFTAFIKYTKSNVTLKGLIEASATSMARLSEDEDFINAASFKDVLIKYKNFTMADNSSDQGIYSQGELSKEDLNYINMYTPTIFSTLSAVYDAEVNKKDSTFIALSSERSAFITSYKQILNNFSISDFFENIEKQTSETPLQKELKMLYESIYLTASEDNKKTYIEIKDLEKLCNRNNEFFKRIQSIGDIKQLEKLGLYNPNKDIASRFGILPAGTKVNLFVKNGREAIDYAKVQFNRYLAEAFQYRVSCIGRVEFMLNRPYFIDIKKAIGLSTSHSLGWSFNSNHISSLELSFIRQNKITYKYNKGNLDEVAAANAPSKTGSIEDFYNEAKNYYTSMKTMQGLKDITNKTQKEVSSGAYSSANFSAGGLVALISGAAVEVGASVANAAIEDNFPTGGIYVAHDWIGHINFDDSGRNDILIENKNLETSSNPLSNSELGKYIITESQSTIISSYIITLDSALTKSLFILEDLWSSRYATYKEDLKALDKLNQELKDIYATEAYRNGTREGVDAINLKTKEIINTKNKITAYNNFKIKAENDYSKLTYAIYGKYTVTYDPESDTRSGNDWDNSITSGYMTDLYNAIPEYSVDGKAIRNGCRIVDDKKSKESVNILGKTYSQYIEGID